MREIKFRGKRLDNGEWVYGSYVEINFHYSNGYVERHLIVALNAHEFEVDPETVGQYVGLKDKSVKEIYDGDVVMVCDCERFEIIFHKGCFCYQIGKGDYHIFNNKEIEIIGNIYDNPELLERRS